MRLDINKRLYDLAIRQAIYVDRVKAAQFLEFNNVMNDLNVELSKILFRTKYKTLDALTKSELGVLIASLRNSQSKIYNNYVTKIIAQLEQFMKDSLYLNQISISSILNGSELSKEGSIRYIIENQQKDNSFLFGLSSVTGNDDLLWSKIKNQPIPANGNLPEALILGFTAAASASVERLIQIGYANRYTFQETFDLAFSKDNPSGGIELSKILINQNNSVIDTVFGDVHSLVYGGVASVLFSAYVWHSIMDSRTSDVCRSRNDNVYRFGKGPLPPAHYRCRSVIAAIYGAFNGDMLPDSLYDWAMSQPEDVMNDLFTSSELESLKTTGKFNVTNGLNLQQYRDKISTLLK